MESIQSSLKQWAVDNERFQQRLNDAKRTLLHDPVVKQALEKVDVSEEVLDQDLIKLYELQKELNHCQQCPGLSQCPNMMKGYQPELIVARKSLDLTYHPCSLKKKADNDRKQRQLINSLYVPKDILQATFDQLDPDHEREEASRKALQFALSAKPGDEGQGLYFYGKFGVGKTYLMGAVANELRDRGIQTFIVYTPDFFREMKSSIGDGTFQEKLDMVKKAQVLILDDIGAETISGWIRDDVLGAILQYRMLENLPTLFTSNYDYDELEEHLSYSERGGIEELKAKRIMERIKHYTSFVTVEGANRRVR
ncbi:primosomal protein DnaI [Halalkalibacter akibai]|uniref:Helicase loader DnaI n=1 Tax=Halalkalibacter akibai (strain ATCC 43226 / DSM 21942 / CIP 109018 / JCM 9157 / 1139) TaxID=1236973 RepID=W4QPU8_HALA3|nr:primosomal protein DnaI [Halalkalibacter akibai]GAE34096.1 helicase loader DnaI [Halalkalibacter akibai JCM 9157]